MLTKILFNVKWFIGKNLHLFFVIAGWQPHEPLSFFMYRFYNSFIFMNFAVVFFKYDSLPERIFRAKVRIADGDQWTVELTDQSSLRFQHRAKYYQDGIDEIINKSDLKQAFKRSEVLALDG